ncbi:hypothetical protein [Candidatus Poriferisodalis sp.]|uniref:hypothetical protein n=1 Tax=Candidatus Poriferisodalis sp. TaxID=3101277 RepID=UPI003C6F10DF
MAAGVTAVGVLGWLTAMHRPRRVTAGVTAVGMLPRRAVHISAGMTPTAIMRVLRRLPTMHRAGVMATRVSAVAVLA